MRSRRGAIPAEMPKNVFDLAVSYLAVGLDPERSIIFVQSDVHEHTELAWLFNAVTPVGDLERMTQYKDKSQRFESIPAGILNYPILQAADVLLYKADAVPVGEDQRQHLELLREIARKFNARYGDTFPETEAVIGEQVGRILGLDGEAKMSKSLGNTVPILAEPDEVWARVRTAVTDPQRVRRDDPGRPEVCNVFTLHGFFTDDETREEIDDKCRTAQIGCVDCKRILSEGISRDFAPFREKAAYFTDNPAVVREILDAGPGRPGLLRQLSALPRRGDQALPSGRRDRRVRARSFALDEHHPVHHSGRFCGAISHRVGHVIGPAGTRAGAGSRGRVRGGVRS